MSISDIVEIYIKKQNYKRGKWSGPKAVLALDPVTGTVTVPGANGRKDRAAAEDVRISVANSDLSSKIQESLDIMDDLLEEATDNIGDNDDAEYELSPTVDNDPSDMDIGEHGIFLTDETPKVGDPVEFYWPMDEEFFPGTVSAYDSTSKMHTISNKDGDVEELNMDNEDWRFRDTSLISNDIKLSQCIELSSTEKESVQMFYNVFEHKEFSLNAAQGLPSFKIENAYKKEEDKFMRTVRLVPTSKVPQGANVITSHVMYKVKASDEVDFYLKARIAPHGN